jgi:hypothetical protein
MRLSTTLSTLRRLGAALSTLRRLGVALSTLGTVSLLLLTVQASAHHSYAATYDVSQTVRLEGQLVRFEFRSPHSYLHMMVEDDSGETQRWAVEWAAPAALVRQGVSRDTLRTGDALVVTARPSRAQGEFRSLMLTLERPADGLTWGTNPDEVVD